MEKRNINFTIRLSQTEYDYIKEQAEAYLLPMGAYIRLKAVQEDYRRKKEQENDRLQQIV